MNPSKVKPAVIGGAVAGLLSAILGIVPVVNYCCCLWVHFVGPGSSWSGRHLEVVTGAGGAWYATSHRRPRNRGIGVSHGRM